MLRVFLENNCTSYYIAERKRTQLRSLLPAASYSPISHMSVRFALWDAGVPRKKNTQLYCLSNINWNASEKKRKNMAGTAGLKNHLNTKCKTHSCVILPPSRGRFRTSGPDFWKGVFAFSNPKEVFCLCDRVG